jgi:hypothetical protein
VPTPARLRDHRSLFPVLWITGQIHARGQVTALSTEQEKVTDDRLGGGWAPHSGAGGGG